MNLLFFGSVFITSLVLGFFFPPQLYEGLPGRFSGNLVLDVLSIFVFNLIVSSFMFVAMPGVVLFPLSAALLVFRAFIWGALIYQLPNWVFLIVLPTLIFEGEGYVFAAIAGTLVGISWVKPEWVYPDEGLSRNVSLRKALRECAGFYVLVAAMLFVAAVVEAATLMLIS